ncbi:MAG: bifunctional adenosylcobinamide kinase/adenosylcobinamide-phosphate guanylyltransferase [Oculatellaceae cyanobacterium bins.114]|nr:bifunctional adenosylcobinamide kinase/adenosylcobinamide-phosphate guanylyltransferase [Oculatellaceae cyanobacterium bins.114]
MTQSLILVTGPARSGKSEWAEQLATQSGRAVIYVATAQTDPTDAEWQMRIAKHQQRRPKSWQTLHVPIALTEALYQAKAEECWLIDSLGTWLANLLEQDESTWQVTVQALLEALRQVPGTTVVVAEETGWGVVPAYPMGRLFRDRLGDLTRRIGAIADSVYLVTAGHALNLSQLGIPLKAELGGFTMSKSDKEIARRTAAALAAIKQLLSEEDSAVSMFVSHHVEELDAAYWEKHASTAKPSPKQVVDLLELRSYWSGDGDDGDVFDFTLPGDVTDYVMSVRFDEDGEVQDVDMES